MNGNLYAKETENLSYFNNQKNINEKLSFEYFILFERYNELLQALYCQFKD